MYLKEDNYASQRIAEKNGFIHTSEGRWQIQRAEYLKEKEEQSQSTIIM